MKIWYCQFDSSKVGGLLNQEIFRHMRRVYDQHEISVPNHFLEIPRWIAVVDGLLGEPENADFREFPNGTKLGILAYLRKAEILLGSVLDSNFQQWLYASEWLGGHGWPGRIILGGYISDERVAELLTANSSVVWCPTVDALAHWLPDMYTGGAPSYRLFADWDTVPRLQLSRGCKHSCSFCTIPQGVEENEWADVLAEVDSFKPLSFRFVYLDDKTFGQAKNWTWLAELYMVIKEYNPAFEGFWVQTTVGMLTKWAEEWYFEYHIKIAEVGIEIPEDTFLKSFRKPYRVKALPGMFAALSKTGLEFVPNLIFGAEGQDYGVTADFLSEYEDQIAWCNLFILTTYADSKGAPGVADTGDLDETASGRSWLSMREIDEMERTVRSIMDWVELKGE